MPIVETRTVQVQVPVVVEIDAALLLPCVAAFTYPSRKITVDDVRRRAAALETALTLCNEKLLEIKRATGKASSEASRVPRGEVP